MGSHISKEVKSIDMMDVDSENNPSSDFIVLGKSYSESRTFSGPVGDKSVTLDRANSFPQTAPKKNIDKEHVTIERIFRISLEESDKFLYLELFHAQLMSQDREIAFRIRDLDEIMISILGQPERKSIIIPYLLETYHRAVEMIEKRFKSEYDSSYKQIRRVIANYFTLVIYSPENFDLKVSKNDIYSNLKKYLNETDEEELGFFFMDIYSSTSYDMSYLASVFAHLFKMIHEENMESKPHFFNLDKIKKNMNMLTSLFEKCPLAAQAYVQESFFNPTIASNTPVNGKSFQTNSFLGPYLNVAVFEADVNTLRNNFPLNKSNIESEAIIKTYSNKLNDYLSEVSRFIYSIFSANETTQKSILNWAYSLISLNYERTKMYQNNQTTSSFGVLLNSLIILLKILFDQQTFLSMSYTDFIFKIVSEIDPLFTFSNNKINFSKFDRVNPDLVKEILENEEEASNFKEYNFNTQIFFIINTLISLTIKSFDDEIGFIANKFDDLIKENKTSDPLFKDYNALLKAASCYLKNTEMNKNLLKMSEISGVFLFSLNNKKYPQISLDKLKIDYYTFLEEFYNFIDTNDNFALSLLPAFIPKNIVTNCLFIRKNHSDILINEINSSKILVYYAIIYSSQIDLIRNPHLRSEIFDILIYLFVIHHFEKNMKISTISKLLNEEFVKSSLIFSIMRVFIDAERLGTSNQFYEKFSIRHKILYLIENIMKANKSLFTQKIIDYANNYKEDCTKMINLLMNDLTFLTDECIERLMDIKRYQDLKEDVEKYNSLDEETKKLEDDKFKDNDRRIRTELKLFNSSMDFMVMISKICQENFLNYKLGERLANLLNYCLDVFTSTRGLKLKVKNMKDYGFDPKFILISLVSTYVSFANYTEFLEFIVKDERSYKIQNFEKVKTIYSRGKISISYDSYQQFEKIVELLKEFEQDLKQKIINYDDAPEEFFDPITTILMEDPVLLPNSNVIVDRNTIETHLLSDPTDPFNRSKLFKEMLVPQDNLKLKISEYKKSKQNI